MRRRPASRSLKQRGMAFRFAISRVRGSQIFHLSSDASLLPKEARCHRKMWQDASPRMSEAGMAFQMLGNLKLAGTTGLEPATSCVTGMRSNQTELRPLETKWQVAGGK